MEQNGSKDGVYTAPSPVVMVYELNGEEVIRVFDKVVVTEEGESVLIQGKRSYFEYRPSAADHAYDRAILHLTKITLTTAEKLKDLEEKNRQLRAQYVQLEKDDLELIESLRGKNLELNKFLETQNQNISELNFKLETAIATSKAHERTVEQQRDAYRELQGKLHRVGVERDRVGRVVEEDSRQRDILAKENASMKDDLEKFYKAYLEPGTDEWAEKHPKENPNA